MRNKGIWKKLMTLAMGTILFVTAPTALVKAEEPEEVAVEEVISAAGVLDENGFEILDGVLTNYWQDRAGASGGDVIIPEGVTSIGSDAFSNCKKVTSVTIPEGVTSIGSGAFRGCIKLTNVTIPSSVTSIEGSTFLNCFSLTSVAIPSSVTSIGKAAFYGCLSLTSVTIPSSVTSIGIATFHNCGKLTIYGQEGSYVQTYAQENNIPFSTGEPPEPTTTELSACTIAITPSSYAYDGKEKKPDVTVKFGNITLAKNKDYSVSYTNNKKIGTATVTLTGLGNYKGTVKKTFKIEAKKGTTVTSGVYKYKFTSASEVAFAGLSSPKTTKVTIPAKVTIGGKSFKITSVDEKALQKKTKVTGVTIGTNVKTIGDNAFNGCKKLKTITIKSTKLTKAGKNAFKGISQTAKIKVPKAKLKAYQKLLKGKGQGKKVKITK